MPPLPRLHFHLAATQLTSPLLPPLGPPPLPSSRPHLAPPLPSPPLLFPYLTISGLLPDPPSPLLRYHILPSRSSPTRLTAHHLSFPHFASLSTSRLRSPHPPSVHLTIPAHLATPCLLPTQPNPTRLNPTHSPRLPLCPFLPCCIPHPPAHPYQWQLNHKRDKGKTNADSQNFFSQSIWDLLGFGGPLHLGAYLILGVGSTTVNVLCPASLSVQVVMAKHMGSGNAVAIKFHKHRELRDYRWGGGGAAPPVFYIISAFGFPSGFLLDSCSRSDDLDGPPCLTRFSLSSPALPPLQPQPSPMLRAFFSGDS